MILADHADYHAALGAFDAAERLAPGNPYLLKDRGVILRMVGAWNLARSDFDRALREREEVESLIQRAVLLACCPDPGVRDGERALKDALRAVELTEETEPLAMDVLGAAYAETGDFEAARAWLEKATARADPDHPARSEWQGRLEGYRRGEPWRSRPKESVDWLVRAPPWRIGDEVFCDWRGDRLWYPGRVVARRLERLLVRYTDDSEEWTTAPLLRHEAVKVGDHVQADWQGRGKHYPGEVRRRHGDEIVIRYDDGDEEATTIRRLVLTKDQTRER